MVMALSAGICCAEPIRVAVASNFSAVFPEIVRRFTQQTHVELKVSYASSGKLATQIQHGAPFHLFLSADREFARQIELSRYGVKGSRKTYAVGELYLWSLSAQLLDGPLWVLPEDTVRWLSLANPRTAPYGRAAAEVMSAMNLWRKFEGRLVYGESVGQAFYFIKTANAELGFVAHAQIVHEPGSRWRIPQGLYSPLEQQLVLLTRGAGNEVVQQFYDYLFTDGVQALIAQAGYRLPVGDAGG